MISFSICVARDNGSAFLLRPSAFEYFADPFILTINGETVYILIEAYRRLRRRGDICLLTVDFRNETYRIDPLIKENHHLSYPCVLRNNGVNFVMPESEAASFQYLYRLEWVQHSLRAYKTIALPGRYVDLTVHPKTNGSYVAQFYNGTTNSNGFLLESEIILDGTKEIRLGEEIRVKGRRRPGGRVYGDVQPFQRPDVEYGSGLDFIDQAGVMFSPAEIGFPALVCALQHRMHHLNQFDSLMVFDVKDRVRPRVMHSGFFASDTQMLEYLK